MLVSHLLPATLAQLHEDVKDVHEEVDDVHVQLDGTFHIIVHLKLVGDAPSVVDKVGAEDGCTEEGDDEPKDPGVQRREEAGQEAEGKEPKHQRPESSPKKREVALGAEGVNRQPCHQEGGDDCCLGYTGPHSHGTGHCGHHTDIQGHDGSEESEAEEVQGVRVLADMAQKQRQAGRQQRPPLECRGPVDDETDDRRAKRSCAEGSSKGRGGHLACDDSVDLADEAQAHLLLTDALEVVPLVLRLHVERGEACHGHDGKGGTKGHLCARGCESPCKAAELSVMPLQSAQSY